MSAELKLDNRVMMSADIVGSTRLYETEGDARARELVASCLSSLKSLCDKHGGRVVAEVGDEIVAMFSDPGEAVGAASEIHAELHDQAEQDTDESPRLRLRIGLHFGPVPKGAELLRSETCRIANWAAGNAKPEQTLATRRVIDQLPRLFRAVSRYVDDETWNFVSLEHVELYEIIWDVESITAYNGEKPEQDAQAYDRVTFVHGDQTVVLDASRPVISIGRDTNNDLVVRKDLVSRQHLSAQFSRGRCTITDNSTNGSVVVAEDGNRYEIKRESFRLMGSGVIIPGHPENETSEFTIAFRCG